jgi:hypothetical protein
MVLVIDGNRRTLRAASASAWRRLQSRIVSHRLDQRLAQGETPEDDVLLALHAQRIVQPAACRELAGTLRRVLQAADGIRIQSRHETPLWPSALRAATDDLRAVATRIEAPGPVCANGVAQLRVLLRDGTGPLYQPQPPEQLQRILQAATQAL